MNELMIEALRKEQAQLIRMMEDAVTINATESLCMYVGKLAAIQSFIDGLSNTEKEWVNEDVY